MVRGRHQPEVGQVRPRVPEPPRGRGDDEPHRERQPAAASLPGRARVRHLRPSRFRRDGREPRGPRAGAGRAPRPAGGRPAGGRLVVRAVGRKGLARRARRGSHPGRGAAGSVLGVRGGGASPRRSRCGARAGRKARGLAIRPIARGRAALRSGRDSRRARLRAHMERGDRRGADAARHALRRRVRPGAARDRGLRRSQVAVHARPRPGGGRARRRDGHPARSAGGRGAPAAESGDRPRPRPAGRLECDLGQAGPARHGRMGTRPDAPVSDRAHAASVVCARPARRHRRRAPGASRRIGLSEGIVGRSDQPARPDPRRRGRVPVDARAASASSRADRGGGRLRATGRCESRQARRRGRRRRSRCGRARGRPPSRVAGRADDPGGRRPAARRTRPVEQADRHATRDHAEDGAQPHRAHLHEDRCFVARRGEPVRDASTACSER